MPIKLVCLNLNRHDTWQQPVPAYKPAILANQKAAVKRIYQYTYLVQRCLYILWNVCSLLYIKHQLHRPLIYRFVHCSTCWYDSKRVYKCIYMYIYFWTMYVHVYTSECTYHVRTMYRRAYTFAEMYIQCTYMYRHFEKCIYNVCPQTYYSIVYTRYIHGTDMSVHVYARWSGFQMKPIENVALTPEPPGIFPLPRNVFPLARNAGEKWRGTMHFNFLDGNRFVWICSCCIPISSFWIEF